MSAIRNIRCDERGATLVEFALISPVLIMLLLGMFEMGYNFYVQAQLQGAVQKAARDSSTQSANASATAVDTKVHRAVRAIVPKASVKFSRRAYSSFNDVNRAEDFTDLDNDGTCNDEEPFEDANGNGTWDADRGTAGSGGARDAVLYVVSVSYPRGFAVGTMLGLSKNVNTQAVTVLRNQPWDAQEIDAGVGNCI